MKKKKINYRPTFIPNQYHHCYNHGIGDELLFRQAENYPYFLQLYKKYLDPVMVLYAFCLMPNHFHFLIRVRSVAELKRHYLHLKPDATVDWKNINWHSFITRQIGNCTNAYAKAINKRFNRRGGLFERDMKRPIIDSETYFLQTLRYIHYNPIRHGFVKELEDWDFTSYHAYLNASKTGKYKTEVLQRLGGIQAFLDFHRDSQDFGDLNNIEEGW